MLLLTAHPGRTAAQGQPGPQWSAADAAALRAYALTMDKLTRTNDASTDLQKLAEAHPELAASPGSGDATTLDEMAARLSAPEVRAVLVKHGLTAKEYVMTFMTAMNAWGAALAEDQGKSATDLPVSAANVKFYRDHKAEIEKMNQAATSGDN
ncbi:MAG TPA: hypothetical protein VMG41_15090 [Gemmatimonadales bacterium]|nr:hypothetical protein [Gemmatimonadales bacterium]